MGLWSLDDIRSRDTSTCPLLWYCDHKRIAGAVRDHLMIAETEALVRVPSGGIKRDHWGLAEIPAPAFCWDWEISQDRSWDTGASSVLWSLSGPVALGFYAANDKSCSPWRRWWKWPELKIKELQQRAVINFKKYIQVFKYRKRIFLTVSDRGQAHGSSTGHSSSVADPYHFPGSGPVSKVGPNQYQMIRIRILQQPLKTENKI